MKSETDKQRMKLKELLESNSNWRKVIVKPQWGFKEDSSFKETETYSEFWKSDNIKISVLNGGLYAHLGNRITAELKQPEKRLINWMLIVAIIGVIVAIIGVIAAVLFGFIELYPNQ